MSFIVLLFALYVVAGGILITGTLRGGPLVNAGILLLGTAMASVVGTTGAAMILVRPLIRANAHARAQRARCRLFHLPGRQYRRRAVAARRSAAVRRLFAWRRVLLDDDAPCLRDRDCRRAGAGDFSGARFLVRARRTESRARGRRAATPARPDQPAADRPHHRRHSAVRRLEARHRFNVYGTHVALQNLVRDGALVASRLPRSGSRRRSTARPTISPGSRLWKWPSCSPAFSSASSRCWRCWRPASTGPSPGCSRRSPRTTARRTRWPISG